MRVTHVINELAAGGAQEQLAQIVPHLAALGIQNTVITLLAEGLDRRVDAPIFTIGVHRGRPSPEAAVRLRKALAQTRPDLVHTWLTQANLVAGGTARTLRQPVVWGVHRTPANEFESTRVRLLDRSQILLSRVVPTRILCCASASADAYVRAGFPAKRTLVAQNGFDTKRFRIDRPARARLRSELGIDDETFVIGCAARFHPQKGHHFLFDAVASIATARPLAILLAGEGIEKANYTLQGALSRISQNIAIHLLGRRSDMAAVFSAMDVLVLPSLREAFPLVLGEAILCGTPCVATDVGDARRIIGNAGLVVPAGDSAALANAIRECIANTARLRAAAVEARTAVSDAFSLTASAKRYCAAYSEVVTADSVKSSRRSRSQSRRRDRTGSPKRARQTPSNGATHRSSPVTIGVLSVNYRNPKRVVNALKAFRKFADAPVDAVIIDNASENCIPPMPGVCVIRNERNVGYAAAVNQGVEALNSDIVLLLNPDVDGWEGTPSAVREVFLDESVVAASPRFIDGHGELVHNCRRAPRPFDFVSESLGLSKRFPHWKRAQRMRMLDWDHTSERDVAAVTGACLFVRRTAFEQVGLFDERFFVYGEEIDWLVRAGKLGLITRFLPSVTVRHTAGNSTPAASAALERLLIESHYRYTAKHFGPTQELTLRATLFVADCVRLMHRPRWLGEFRKRALVHLGLRYERPR